MKNEKVKMVLITEVYKVVDIFLSSSPVVITNSHGSDELPGYRLCQRYVLLVILAADPLQVVSLQIAVIIGGFTQHHQGCRGEKSTLLLESTSGCSSSPLSYS